MVRGVHKIYLSAILDLYDRHIVSYVISDHNDNPIVFDTFKATVKANPDVHQPNLSPYVGGSRYDAEYGSTGCNCKPHFLSKNLPARMRSRAGRFLLMLSKLGRIL